MSYFRLFGLGKDPFSTSPDPSFFYESKEHHAALVSLMIEIRLKRGMSLILGDVGTGKTTLSRKLIQMFKDRSDIVFHVILDPAEESEERFLAMLLRAFNIPIRHAMTPLDCKEAIKRYLFQKGVSERKTIVLLIDEGQKLSRTALEILRTLLNYETNEYKLLQLVLLGQMELLPEISTMKNLWDRISLKFVISPLDLQATREMISFRLRQAGYGLQVPLFADQAVALIHQQTQGSPRRIAMLCHTALKTAVLKNKNVVDEEIMQDILGHEMLVTA